MLAPRTRTTAVRGQPNLLDRVKQQLEGVHEKSAFASSVSSNSAETRGRTGASTTSSILGTRYDVGVGDFGDVFPKSKDPSASSSSVGTSSRFAPASRRSLSANPGARQTASNYNNVDVGGIIFDTTLGRITTTPGGGGATSSSKQTVTTTLSKSTLGGTTAAGKSGKRLSTHPLIQVCPVSNPAKTLHHQGEPFPYMAAAQKATASQMVKNYHDLMAKRKDVHTMDALLGKTPMPPWSAEEKAKLHLPQHSADLVSKFVAELVNKDKHAAERGLKKQGGVAAAGTTTAGGSKMNSKMTTNFPTPISHNDHSTSLPQGDGALSLRDYLTRRVLPYEVDPRRWSMEDTARHMGLHMTFGRWKEGQAGGSPRSGDPRALSASPILAGGGRSASAGTTASRPYYEAQFAGVNVGIQPATLNTPRAPVTLRTNLQPVVDADAVFRRGTKSARLSVDTTSKNAAGSDSNAPSPRRTTSALKMTPRKIGEPLHSARQTQAASNEPIYVTELNLSDWESFPSDLLSGPSAKDGAENSSRAPFRATVFFNPCSFADMGSNKGGQVLTGLELVPSKTAIEPTRLVTRDPHVRIVFEPIEGDKGNTSEGSTSTTSKVVKKVTISKDAVDKNPSSDSTKEVPANASTTEVDLQKAAGSSYEVVLSLRHGARVTQHGQSSATVWLSLVPKLEADFFDAETTFARSLRAGHQKGVPKIGLHVSVQAFCPPHVASGYDERSRTGLDFASQKYEIGDGLDFAVNPPLLRRPSVPGVSTAGFDRASRSRTRVVGPEASELLDQVKLALAEMAPMLKHAGDQEDAIAALGGDSEASKTRGTGTPGSSRKSTPRGAARAANMIAQKHQELLSLASELESKLNPSTGLDAVVIEEARKMSLKPVYERESWKRISIVQPQGGVTPRTPRDAKEGAPRSPRASTRLQQGAGKKPAQQTIGDTARPHPFGRKKPEGDGKDAVPSVKSATTGRDNVDHVSVPKQYSQAGRGEDEPGGATSSKQDNNEDKEMREQQRRSGARTSGAESSKAVAVSRGQTPRLSLTSTPREYVFRPSAAATSRESLTLKPLRSVNDLQAEFRARVLEDAKPKQKLPTPRVSVPQMEARKPLRTQAAAKVVESAAKLREARTQSIPAIRQFLKRHYNMQAQGNKAEGEYEAMAHASGAEETEDAEQNRGGQRTKTISLGEHLGVADMIRGFRSGVKAGAQMRDLMEEYDPRTGQLATSGQIYHQHVRNAQALSSPGSTVVAGGQRRSTRASSAGRQGLLRVNAAQAIEATVIDRSNQGEDKAGYGKSFKTWTEMGLPISSGDAGGAQKRREKTRITTAMTTASEVDGRAATKSSRHVASRADEMNKSRTSSNKMNADEEGFDRRHICEDEAASAIESRSEKSSKSTSARGEQQPTFIRNLLQERGDGVGAGSVGRKQPRVDRQGRPKKKMIKSIHHAIEDQRRTRKLAEEQGQRSLSSSLNNSPEQSTNSPCPEQPEAGAGRSSSKHGVVVVQRGLTNSVAAVGDSNVLHSEHSKEGIDRSALLEPSSSSSEHGGDPWANLSTMQPSAEAARAMAAASSAAVDPALASSSKTTGDKYSSSSSGAKKSVKVLEVEEAQRLDGSSDETELEEAARELLENPHHPEVQEAVRRRLADPAVSEGLKRSLQGASAVHEHMEALHALYHFMTPEEREKLEAVMGDILAENERKARAQEEERIKSESEAAARELERKRKQNAERKARGALGRVNGFGTRAKGVQGLRSSRNGTGASTAATASSSDVVVNTNTSTPTASSSSKPSPGQLAQEYRRNMEAKYAPEPPQKAGPHPQSTSASQSASSGRPGGGARAGVSGGASASSASAGLLEAVLRNQEESKNALNASQRKVGRSVAFVNNAIAGRPPAEEAPKSRASKTTTVEQPSGSGAPRIKRMASSTEGGLLGNDETEFAGINAMSGQSNQRRASQAQRQQPRAKKGQ
ncbi:unnamed protein product [Amoebophrya sp. A25]|nr:unnamed protein product [Amoebophrya sp. A25]|eukprot:GSA25T00016021001.1